MKQWEQKKQPAAQEPIDIESIVAATTERVINQMIRMRAAENQEEDTTTDQLPGGANNSDNDNFDPDSILNRTGDSDMTMRERHP